MFFKYQGYDSFGSRVKGVIEASDIETAKIKLKQQKIIYEKLIIDNGVDFFDFKTLFSQKKTISSLLLSSISKDLSIYLNAGISLPNSVKLINERYKNDKQMDQFFASVLSFLNEGKNFFTSLETQTVIKLPEFYLQSIKVSEDGGILQDVLLELSNYLIKEYKLEKQISQAMIYPSFIIVISVLMVAFMLSFIVPKITDIFAQSNQELPEITTFVISCGNFMSNNYISLAFFVIVFIFLFNILLQKLEHFRYSFDNFLLHFPLVGNIIELNELSRFSYMNAILLKSGVSVVVAFKMSSNTLGNSVLRKLFSDASNKVVEGERLSKILEANKIYPLDIAFIQAIAIGEETSQLEPILQNLAELYSSKNSDKLHSFLTLLEPALMLLVGGIIGFIVIAMLLPIFSMSVG